MSTWLIVSFVLLAGFVWAIVSHHLLKQHIQEIIETNSCKMLKIKWLPFSEHAMGERNDSVFSVIYQTPDGETISTLCKANANGVYWLEKSPDLYHQKVYTPKKCISCGYNFDGRWDVCPKCGHDANGINKVI
jgi:predicted Zn-ribbon and HTH transcriptional regulator